MDIVIYPDKLLSTPAEVIGNIDGPLQNLIDNMIKTMIDHNALGLAAPQVGESKRLIVCKYQDLPLVLINPTIKKVDEAGFARQEEACLSIINFQAYVVRALRIKVSCLDKDGTEQRFEADGMLARIIQHEVDHLDGKLFIDRIDLSKRLNYNRDLQKMMRKRGY